MTIEDLRQRFWWLGPDKPGSNILALDGNNVTVKVLQPSWKRLTAAYEESVARDFSALGLKVTWVPFWADGLQAQIDEAHEDARKRGKPFDEAAFVEKKRREERK